jgi:hypothetical protein
VALQNANHNTITKQTPDAKIQVAQIGLFEQMPYKRGIASKGSYQVLESIREAIRRLKHSTRKHSSIVEGD